MIHYSMYQCYGFLLFLLRCILGSRTVIHTTLESPLTLINRLRVNNKYIAYSSIVNRLSMPIKRCNVTEKESDTETISALF